MFSEAVLLALVESGLGRDDAYRLTQRAATAPGRSADRSATCSAKTPRSARTCPRRLDECFDLDRAVAHAARAVDALDGSDDGGEAT